jgi:hypothetical protein
VNIILIVKGVSRDRSSVRVLVKTSIAIYRRVLEAGVNI